MLTDNLRKLESARMVVRKDLTDVVLHTEYSRMCCNFQGCWLLQQLPRKVRFCRQQPLASGMPDHSEANRTITR